ncbi:MAG: RelA/SpoT family protein [Candidatus Saccharimonadales bacterium]
MKKSECLAKAKGLFDENQVVEIEDAITLATEKHKGQKRRSGEAYITHPLAVAGILCDWGMDIDTILAGILHDTLEDTDITIDEIEKKFGHDVAFLVDGVTKISKARSGMRNLDSYLPSTKDNLTKLLIAVGEDVRVVIIKLADRLHNMQTLQHMPLDKQKKIARETLEVFAPLADRLNMGRVRVQLEELAFSYLEPKTFRKLSRELKSRLGKSHRKLATVRHSVDKKLTEQGVEHTMDGRIKSVYSLHKKLQKIPDIDEIYDLIALRVIVDDVATCYRVLGIIHGMYQPMVKRIKDYIARPKPNGYQSLHTTVMTDNGEIVEFQIRTEAMHDYAERGLAASFHYNEQKLAEAYKKGQMGAMPADLAWISELQEVAAKLREGKEVDVENLKPRLFRDQIFVYSPKGDIFTLPEGSFPLDFAYRVHSDVAKTAVGFKVNGKMVSFDRQLENGDHIEIITKRNTGPSLQWFKTVLTSHAREKLRAQLKKQ